MINPRNISSYKYLLAGLFLLSVSFSTYSYLKPSAKLIVLPQTIQNGQITINRLDLPSPGWVVLSSTKYDQPTVIIGKIKVERGRHKDVGVYVNVLQASELIEAAVYYDRGEPGVFDQATDVPVLAEDRPLKVRFERL